METNIQVVPSEFVLRKYYGRMFPYVFSQRLVDMFGVEAHLTLRNSTNVHPWKLTVNPLKIDGWKMYFPGGGRSWKSLQKPEKHIDKHRTFENPSYLLMAGQRIPPLTYAPQEKRVKGNNWLINPSICILLRWSFFGGEMGGDQALPTSLQRLLPLWCTFMASQHSTQTHDVDVHVHTCMKRMNEVYQNKIFKICGISGPQTCEVYLDLFST